MDRRLASLVTCCAHYRRSERQKGAFHKIIIIAKAMTNKCVHRVDIAALFVVASHDKWYNIYNEVKRQPAMQVSNFSKPQHAS